MAAGGGPHGGIKSVTDILADAARRESLPLAHPEHPRGFEVAGGYITLYWGYEYDIPLSRIPNPEALLEWVEHIAPKNWRGFSGQKLAAFIGAIRAAKGWTRQDP